MLKALLSGLSKGDGEPLHEPRPEPVEGLTPSPKPDKVLAPIGFEGRILARWCFLARDEN